MTAPAPDFPAFVQAMAELHGRPEAAGAAVTFETGQFLYGLVRLIRPGLVVELGTHRGVSTLWLARGLQDGGRGRLLSFDLFERTEPGEARRALLALGLADRVEIHRAASSIGAVEIVRRRGASVDLLFVDADHRVEATAADVQSFWPSLAAGGHVLLHDICPRASGWDGPRYVLDALKGARLDPQSLTVIELPTVEGWGLALIQKTSARTPRLIPWLAYGAYQWRTRFRFWLRSGRGDSKSAS